METLRLELRCRNNVLWHLIFDQYPSVAAFVRDIFPEATTSRTQLSRQLAMGQLLNLTRSPYRTAKDGDLRWIAAAVCERCGLSRGELFPPDLYASTLPRRAVAEIDPRRLLPLAGARRLALPAPQDDLVERQELRWALRASLATLTPREARVILARFGIGGEWEAQTLQTIGETLGLSRDRIRQIEARALRKLRRPSCVRRLSPFVQR